jgi:aminoglycoside 6-adenylyltransferase
MPGSAAGGDGWTGLEGLLDLRGRLHAWASTRDGIIGALAFGSTERADRPADAWSDLDLVFLVEDLGPWHTDLSWTDAIGPSWLRFLHDAPIPGIRVAQVLFDGGYDVDLVPIDAAGLAVLADPAVAGAVIGPGARVVRDEDGRLGAVAAAAVASPGVEPPEPAMFEHDVATFLYQVAWATKRLRRGERWRAWDDTAGYLRVRLLRMLEWQALARAVPGVFPDARRIEHWLPADVARRLPATFARPDAGELADAIPALLALYTDAAREVADASGFRYPAEAEASVGAWVRARLAEADGLGSG